MLDPTKLSVALGCLICLAVLSGLNFLPLHGRLVLQLREFRAQDLANALMVHVAMKNATVLDYVFPWKPTTDVHKNWVPYTGDCEVSHNCWCTHVQGSMSRDQNPKPEKCAEQWTTHACSVTLSKGKPCSCLVPSLKGAGACLFGDMRPVKILAAVSLSRFKGVTRIIEEGRYGGLSTLVYDIHGFNVTSIEFLPLDQVTVALQHSAPRVALLTGDGRELTPRAVSEHVQLGERVMVVFDGTKRFDAYKTWEKIKHLVVFGIFDDTNIVDGKEFRKYLAWQGEVFWNTDDEGFHQFVERESAPLKALLEPIRNASIMGGVQMLQIFHFTIVQGGRWRS